MWNINCANKLKTKSRFKKAEQERLVKGLSNISSAKINVMCSEVMYGAYYPYLYGRAGPSRPFYQYDRVRKAFNLIKENI